MRIGFILYRLVDFYELLILATCILSWFPARGLLGDIYQALRRVTDPFIDIFRRIIPNVGGQGMSIDFSPMLAIVVLDLIKRFVLRL